MHRQKPEQQLKSILHKRTTPNSNKPNPNFSGTRYRHAEEAGEKQKQLPRTLRKRAESFGNLQSSLVTKKPQSKDHPGKKSSKLLTGKQPADRFTENYANESKIPFSAPKQIEARTEMRERTAMKPMQQPLRLGELQRVVNKLKARKSPGPDGITNEMLIHLGSATVCKLLQIFNHSWELGVLP